VGYLAEQSAIETWFTSNWPHTNIVYDNGEVLQDTEWVRISVQPGEAKQVSMGDNPSFRHYGAVFLQIYTAVDTGSGRALELADLAEVLFRNAVVSGIVFKVPEVRKPRQGDVEGYQVNVITDFYRGF
jgi:hypothetical protein